MCGAAFDLVVTILTTLISQWTQSPNRPKGQFYLACAVIMIILILWLICIIIMEFWCNLVTLATPTTLKVLVDKNAYSEPNVSFTADLTGFHLHITLCTQENLIIPVNWRCLWCVAYMNSFEKTAAPAKVRNAGMHEPPCTWARRFTQQFLRKRYMLSDLFAVMLVASI